MDKLIDIDFKTCFYSDIDKKIFFSAFTDFMNKFGCSYLGYVFEDTEKEIRYGFSSNPDWQNEYIGNHLIDDCHLWKTVVKHFVLCERNYLILPWETVKPENKKEKEIVLYRSEMDIGQNGISFCTQKNGFREYFAVLPDTHNPNFLKYVSQNINLLKDHLKIFRKATMKELKSQHLTEEV